MSLDDSAGNVLIALRFDPFHETQGECSFSYEEENTKILSIGLAIAYRSRCKARLISVYEPGSLKLTATAPWLTIIPSQRLRLEMINNTVRREACANLSRQLSSIASSASTSVSISTHLVVAATAAQGIIAESIASKSTMIVTGAGTKADRYLTRGFSTPLAVMADSSVPVAVVGIDCDTSFETQALPVLICDDLREETGPAMRRALEWTSTVGPVDLLHLHVEERSADEMRRILANVAHEMLSPVDPMKLTADLMQALDDAFRARIASRLGDIADGVTSAGGAYKYVLRRSPYVRDEIERMANEHSAAVIIFGRHEKVHRRPYLIGRITYQSMLSQKHLVVVVP